MSESKCQVSNCLKITRTRGYCVAHYTKWRRYGNPLIWKNGRGLSESNRFWHRVHKSNSCWLWTGARIKSGYGNFRLSGPGPVVAAHRYSWTTLVGPIPEGMVLDHLCRVRHCVNPDHLEVVTVVENTLRGMSPSTVTFRTNICHRGHDMNETARHRPSGRRSCYACEKRLQHA